MKSNNVVARYRDGRILKGSSLNIDPNRPTFHLRTEDDGVKILMLRELKALFVVKDPNGNAMFEESFDPTPGDVRLLGSITIAVHFEDGETIVGMSRSYPPVASSFFFMVPIDPKSNNIRILVNLDAVKGVDRVEVDAPPVARAVGSS